MGVHVRIQTAGSALASDWPNRRFGWVRWGFLIMELPTVRPLECLVAVAKALSFRQAAEAHTIQDQNAH